MHYIYPFYDNMFTKSLTTVIGKELSRNIKFRIFLYVILKRMSDSGGFLMKTFKMLSFDLVTEDGMQNFPLVDGIVINQENSHQSWILELFISQKYHSTFTELLEKKVVFDVRAVISFPENDPAPFRVAVHTIQEIGDHLSVLLKGTLKTRRSKYAEQLLAELLSEGISVEELLNRFSHDMKMRPKLKND